MSEKLRNLYRDHFKFWPYRRLGSSRETPAERRAHQAPQPLPRERPRVLTILESPVFIPIDGQTQSTLLYQLPYEVRRQIYEEVLGGHLLHIVRMMGRLAHVNCKHPSAMGTNTRRHECWGYMNKDMVYLRGRPRDGGLLSLLKTCRQV